MPMVQTKEAIEREDHNGKGRYVIRTEGGEAELTYLHAGDNLFVVDHTYVPPALRGRGLAEVLIERSVEDARAEGSKMVPLCSYVRAAFRRHPEWQDVLNDSATFSLPDDLRR